MNYDPNEDYSDGKVTSSEKAAVLLIAVVVLLLLFVWKIYG
jgi:hypothetical protein